MLKTISIVITGRVQGVFFRQSAREMAMALGIKGHVKNLPDGNVYIAATGTKEQLDKMVAWCRQGPPKAKVTGVELQELSLQAFDRFSVERS